MSDRFHLAFRGPTIAPSRGSGRPTTSRGHGGLSCPAALADHGRRPADGGVGPVGGHARDGPKVRRVKGISSATEEAVAMLRLVTKGAQAGRADAGWDAVRHTFPTVELVLDGAAPDDAPVVDAKGWCAPTFDPFELDRRIGDAASGLPPVLVLALGAGDDGPLIATQVLTRLQGGLRRTNACSEGPLFEAALRQHRALHDLSKPLVRADYTHALDAWQWVLRLNAEASLAVQLAAVFHDVERLVSEADVRIEHHAADYQAFKDAHARTGARLTRELLAGLGCPAAVLDRVESLVRDHERTDRDPERALLCDADALSFFALNAPAFLSYYGPDHTRRKIAWSLARLRPPARAQVRRLRSRDDVERLVREQLDFLESADLDWGPR